MGLAVKVITDYGEEIPESYLVRIGGWTEDRYFAEAPEMRFCEFEDGELIMPSPVNVRHQELVRFLTVLLQMYVSSKRLGKVLNGPAVARLRPGLCYEPDLFFVPQKQQALLKEQYFAGAPEMVVEVVSPGGRQYDLKEKAANYEKHGVREYWVIDPVNSTLYRHAKPSSGEAPYLVQEWKAGRVASSVVQGFWIDAAWLWQDPLPEERTLLEQILG